MDGQSRKKFQAEQAFQKQKSLDSFESRLNVKFGDSADRTGLEPATSAVTGRHSNQLNYRSVDPDFPGVQR
jgi:hypothetical protein